MIHFVDFEASSLLPGSFPIEVAWVRSDGHSESYLIRPPGEWLAVAGAWSSESEAIHGISLDTLLKDGVPVDKVARRVTAALSPRSAMAFSDAPGFDGFWMERLLESGGQPRSVRLLDVQQAYGWACKPLLDTVAGLDGAARARAEQDVRRLATEIVSHAVEAEAVLSRIRHRALADAESLHRTWQAIHEEVQRRIRCSRGAGENA